MSLGAQGTAFQLPAQRSACGSCSAASCTDNAFPVICLPSSLRLTQSVLRNTCPVSLLGENRSLPYLISLTLTKALVIPYLSCNCLPRKSRLTRCMQEATTALPSGGPGQDGKILLENESVTGTARLILGACLGGVGGNLPLSPRIELYSAIFSLLSSFSLPQPSLILSSEEIRDHHFAGFPCEGLI